MNTVALAIHGGASEETSLLKNNSAEYEASLKKIVESGYELLKQGGSSVDAVELTVKQLEDNPLFNAGCGSVLNKNGEVEMDASIMDGDNLKAGGVSILKAVKNPISLARKIMEETHHVLLSGQGAFDVAKAFDIELAYPSYFITDYQYQEFLNASKKESMQDILNKKVRGTVGAIALDKQGNLAAATSTGGTSNSLPGRVGDSCIIGAGCYANDKCAISCTGEGEGIITGVVAHTIAMLKECNDWSLQKACDYVVHERNKKIQSEVGVISISLEGEIGISYNTEIMKRAWIGSDGKTNVKIY